MRSVVIGMFGWVIAAAAAEGEIRVRLQDYANVAPVWLVKAKAVATAILASAGVAVSWWDCSPSSEERDAVCSLPPGPMDIQMRILTEAMAKRLPRTRNSMGSAMVTGRFPSIASAFYHRAEELDGGKSGAAAEILGGILAHEIGHLLLAERSHSATGLLRAHWENEDLRRIACGTLRFTPEQAARMLSLVAERMGAMQSGAE